MMAIKLNQKNPDLWIGAGMTYEQLGRYQEAAQAYYNALKINPDYAEPYYQIGRLFLLADMLDEAGKYFSKAFELDSSKIDEFEEEFPKYKRYIKKWVKK
jgi:tetratricopeptide (TPR) repeat protein